MAMACEIKSLQEGNEPLLASGKEKSMKEAEERRENTEKENKELYKKLENAQKTFVEVIEIRNTLMKVLSRLTTMLK